MTLLGKEGDKKSLKNSFYEPCHAPRPSRTLQPLRNAQQDGLRGCVGNCGLKTLPKSNPRNDALWTIFTTIVFEDITHFQKNSSRN